MDYEQFHKGDRLEKAPYNRCEQAMKSGHPVLPLSDALRGSRYRVCSVDAEKQTRARLTSMGIKMGSNIGIVSHQARGMVLALGNGRLAVGSNVLPLIRVVKAR